ncbi:MAG TPA: type II toxin-antitoxin system YhaV family toxin [Longimicrobium sp.]|nr:type II toxin-antitoxin system YhaV family toxin [Longimicrobium sp.]
MHASLLDQLEKLVAAAEVEKGKRAAGDPAGFHMKVAAAIRHLILHEIPEDPARSKYRQGDTLGAQRKHWLRAKFGNGRFRLFFRYHTKARLIVVAWVNDAETLRTYGSRTDAYVVFGRMLDSGNPPDDWDALVGTASSPDAMRRARRLFDAPPDPEL